MPKILGKCYKSQNKHSQRCTTKYIKKIINVSKQNHGVVSAWDSGLLC